jgi:hypothetical protein
MWRWKMKNDSIQKVYLVCAWTDEKAKSIKDAPNIGVEFMGHCLGYTILETGEIIGQHHSSSFGWLREDLKSKVDCYAQNKNIPRDSFEVIDLIGKDIPDWIISLLPKK